MLFAELAERPLEDLMEYFVFPVHARKIPPSERPNWLAEVAVQIAQTGEAGISFLLWRMPRASAAKLRAIFVALSLVGSHLALKRREEIGDRIIQYLDDPRALVLADAIDALRGLDYQAAMEIVLTFRKHRSPYVVGSVLRFLSAHDRKRAIPLLEAALESESSIIRQNAIDELDDLQYVRALPRIRRLLDDPDRHVRQAAKTAVANLEDIARGR